MLGATAIAAFEKHGARVLVVADVLGKGATDEAVAELAHLQKAFVATKNVKHFNRLISRRPQDNHNRLRWASLLAIECEYDEIEARLRAVWSSIAFEWQQAQARDDKRVIITLGPDYLKIFR